MEKWRQILEEPIDWDSPDLLEWEFQPEGFVGLTNAELRPDAPFNVRLAQAYGHLTMPNPLGAVPSNGTNVETSPCRPSNTSAKPHANTASLNPQPGWSSPMNNSHLDPLFHRLGARENQEDPFLNRPIATIQSHIRREETDHLKRGTQQLSIEPKDQIMSIKSHSRRRTFQDLLLESDTLQSPTHHPALKSRRKNYSGLRNRSISPQAMLATPVSVPQASDTIIEKYAEHTTIATDTQNSAGVDWEIEQETPTRPRLTTGVNLAKPFHVAPAKAETDHISYKLPSVFLKQKRAEAIENIDNKYANTQVKTKLREIFNAKGWPKRFMSDAAYNGPPAAKGERWVPEDSQALLILRDVAENIPYSVLADVFFPGRSISSVRHHFTHVDRLRGGTVSNWAG